MTLITAKLRFRIQILIGAILLFGLLFLVGCSLVPISKDEAAKLTQVREAEIDVNVKQTLLAQQQIDLNLEQTQQVGSITSTPSPPPDAATQPENPPEPQSNPPDQTTEVPPSGEATPIPIDQDAFKAWTSNAKILLYEDMTARTDTVRYVKTTLDEMGLKYKDDGSAYGWFLDDIKNGPSGGGVWDLVIIATEDKAGLKGSFFDGILKTIDQGSSVIFETWYLDNVFRTAASGLLTRCGVEFENNWVRIPPSRAALFNLNPNNQIMNFPNKTLNFSQTTNYWWDPEGKISYDVGDLIKLSPQSKATLLLGTIASSEASHGTSAVCMDGKLIFQTFSSHVLNFDVMGPLWENYITHSLLTRFSNLN